MKKNLYLIFILLSIAAHGQNLVPNNSFETLASCPTAQAQLDLAIPWDVVPNTGGASPDLFNSCNVNGFGVPANVVGFQNARTGVGYAGFYTFGYNCREYIQAPLISPLMAGVTYSIEVYVTPAEEAGIAVDGIGIYISTGAVTGGGNYDPLPVTPQITNPVNSLIDDTLGWTLVSGLYVASGGEDHITIGNFLDDLTTDTFLFNQTGWTRGYYFADDVSVTALINLPGAAFSAPNQICPGTCTSFLNASTNANSYQWNFPGAMPDTSTAIDPANICYNTPGNYDVTLIASNANGSDTLTLLNYITVYPQPLPQGISQSGDTLSANAGASSYQWYYNGNIIIGATDYFYVALESGSYNVVVTDNNGCEVEAVINDVIAAVNPLSFGDGSVMRLYPNPVQDKFTIQNLEVRKGTSMEISIYNMIGENVTGSAPISFGEDPDSYQDGGESVDCHLLPAGIYYLVITSDKKSYRTKFVKQ